MKSIRLNSQIKNVDEKNMNLPDFCMLKFYVTIKSDIHDIGRVDVDVLATAFEYTQVLTCFLTEYPFEDYKCLSTFYDYICHEAFSKLQMNVEKCEKEYGIRISFEDCSFSVDISEELRQDVKDYYKIFPGPM